MSKRDDMTADELEKLAEAQGEVEECIKLANSIRQDLECAESCETMEDFLANLESAIESATDLRRALKAIQP